MNEFMKKYIRLCSRLVLFIGDNQNGKYQTASMIRKQMDVGTSTIQVGCDFLVKGGLIRRTRIGRKNLIKLTKKGERVYKHLAEIRRLTK